METDEDLTVLEQLDFVPEDQTCAWCTKQATWLMTSRCCKTGWKLCEECREYVLKHRREGPNRYCKVCGFRWNNQRTINYDWEKL